MKYTISDIESLRGVLEQSLGNIESYLDTDYLEIDTGDYKNLIQTGLELSDFNIELIKKLSNQQNIPDKMFKSLEMMKYLFEEKMDELNVVMQVQSILKSEFEYLLKTLLEKVDKSKEYMEMLNTVPQKKFN